MSLMIVMPVPWILLQSLKLDTRMSPLVMSRPVGKLGSTKCYAVRMRSPFGGIVDDIMTSGMNCCAHDPRRPQPLLEPLPQGASPAQPGPAPVQDATPAPAGPGAQSMLVRSWMASLRSSERIDWRRSIVDLMKLINLDSSLAARKQLALELNYTGDMNDSASMNIWLRKQVMIKWPRMAAGSRTS